MQKKILHIVPSFDIGGMEKVICKIINYSSAIYDHKVLSLSKNTEAMSLIERNNATVAYLEKNEIRSLFFKDLYRYINRSHVDLLMTYNWGAIDAIWIGSILRVRNIIHNIHGISIDEYDKIIWKRKIFRLVIYRMANKIIVASNNLKNQTEKKYFIDKRKILYIPNGIDTDIYCPDRNTKTIKRRELNLSDRDFVVGFVGRLDPIKNFHLMLKVFSLCVDKDKNFKLLIVGDGEQSNEIKNLCHKFDIENNVVMVGKKIDVIPYLRSMDILFMTSFSEQMPISIIEAMSIGLPVISSDVGETSNIIDHGKSGYIFHLNEKPENIADLLFDIKYNDDYTALSENSRKKIKSEFQEKKMLQTYLNAIKSFI